MHIHIFTNIRDSHIDDAIENWENILINNMNAIQLDHIYLQVLVDANFKLGYFEL
jgi:hypothetical protein